mgnify:FL=1
MSLENINSPADVKKLSVGELTSLCAEMREALIQKLSVHGGHVGPNLGMVEATVAMHYVMNSPVDKFVFDVSHQSYAHKMLTGRKEAFTNPDCYDEVSGYTEPSESVHDHFVIGHTSTSVSLASGLAKARDLRGERFNVVAVIGDGSLSGGEAFEGLDVAAELGSNMIVVVNDNQMSIAENHGGLYRNLQLLRETNGEAPCNFFKAMGFDYLYVADGNDVEAMIEAFRRVRDIDHPVVLHINTLKGKGYRFAETYKERFHWSMPFDIPTGELKKPAGDKGYDTLTAEHLLSLMKADRTVVGITAGTPAVFGFTKDRRERAGKQFIDMGIAEEQAVAMASALAKGGAKPVFGVYSTFIQRAYDQLSQDLCINNNPATILVFWGSLGAMNDVTHLCLFDIPLISNIPNMVYLAPTCREEYLAMLDWSIQQTEHPVAIRVPATGVAGSRSVDFPTDYEPEMNRFEMDHCGSGVAIIGVGNFFALAVTVAEQLKQSGIDATVVNPRFLTGLDTEHLEGLRDSHSLVVTLEDGVLDGGYGEKIARYYGESEMRVMCRGVRKEFIDRYNVGEEYAANRLTPDQITADILEILN